MSARGFIARCITSAAVLAGVCAVAPAAAQTSPSAYTSAVRYDAVGRVTGTIAPDPDGVSPWTFLAVRTTYDPAGRPTIVEQGWLAAWQSETIAPSAWSEFTVSSSVETTYDAVDHKLSELAKGSDGVAVSLTQYKYDEVGRLKCTAQRMNPPIYAAILASNTISACELAEPEAQAGPFGPDRITRHTYDDVGQLTKIEKAVGTTIAQDYASYTYSANGKQLSMTDARGYRAEFKYDGFDRQIAWVFPSKTATGTAASCNLGTVTEVSGIAGPSGSYVATDDCEKYFYDRNGNRAKLAKRDGLVIDYQFDNLNRMTVKTIPELTWLDPIHTRDVYYSYDLRGLVTGTRFASVTGKGMGFVYDGFGRLKSSTENWVSTVRTLNYEYDPNGNRTRLTFPDTNYVTYEYDGLDRPKAILRSGATTVASYTYDAAGRRDSFGGGVTTSYGYDAIGRLNALTNNLPASAWNNQWTFTFNPAGQIQSQTRTNDLFAWTAHVNVDRPYTANGLNQYTAAGPASFCYDANGNLTADGASVYKYDVENRLIEKRAQTSTACPTPTSGYTGAIQAGLRYDVQGRLYAVSGPSGWGAQETRLFYDGDALIGEYTDTGTLLRRYVHGADAKADDPLAWYEGAGFTAAEERRLRPDWQGSIALVTDSSGSTVLTVNRYDEYGIPQSTNQGRFQYTGQAWLPELGMYYYKARIYSPTLGRFLQVDPIGYDDQVNLYAYVYDDPINNTDFSGRCGPALPLCIVAAEELIVQGAIILTAACVAWCPRIEPPTLAPPRALPAPQRPTASEVKKEGEPRGAHGTGARPSTKGKHDKANARRQREQTRSAEAKEKRGTTRGERREERKKYKESEDYRKPTQEK